MTIASFQVVQFKTVELEGYMFGFICDHKRPYRPEVSCGLPGLAFFEAVCSLE